MESWERMRLVSDEVLGSSAVTRLRARELIERVLALDSDHLVAWALHGWLQIPRWSVEGRLFRPEVQAPHGVA
jgi:hypothetical protein